MGADNKRRLREMFDDVLESPELDEEAVAAHFSPDYQQHVDGHTLDYEAFLDHMRAQKEQVADTRVTIDRLIAEDDAVVSLHRVGANKRAGGRVEGRVFAYWRFRDGLIVECDELTAMTVGSAEDRDLGHRT